METGFWPGAVEISGKVPARIFAFLCLPVHPSAILNICTTRLWATKSPETGSFGASADMGWSLQLVADQPLFPPDGSFVTDLFVVTPNHKTGILELDGGPGRRLQEEDVMNKYWLVGASWGGTDHQDDRFVREGFWMLGWEDGKQPELAAHMKPGDRIAIKRMKGRAQTGIRIMHIGVIKGVILDTSKIVCTVEWAATNLNRDVAESRGCFQSIHGPFEHDSWIQEVFCL